MYTPQAGIFALGTSSHSYLEFDLLDAANYKQFASTIAAIREPRTTTGGVNFVIGFRPELWREIASRGRPAGRRRLQQEHPGYRRISSCPPRSTMRWSGSPAVRTTSSSIWRAPSSMTSQARPRWAKKPPAGPTATIAISPASSMAQKILPCSTLPSTLSCPKAFPAPPAPSCCCKSGSTTSASGKHCPSTSRSSSWGAPSPTARTREQAGGLPRRPHRSGRVRQHLSP